MMCSILDVTLLSVLVLAAMAGVAYGAPANGAPSEAPARFGDAARDADGFATYTIDSPRQSAPTMIRVLLPDANGQAVAKGKPARVLYVLPVEAGRGSRWGDGLAEVRKADLHNRYGLICVEPTFSALPWYADHPTDPNCRQESYFIEDVLPFVERTLKIPDDPNSRLLVGFSKSGWGAWSLLLRHPDVFARAAAWDAPLAETTPAKYGMKGIIATQANFEKYRITALLAAVADADATAADGAKRFLGRPARLSLHGYSGFFRKHHQSVRELMTKLKIPHDYLDGPKRKHCWSSGWLSDAVKFVAGPSRQAPPRP